MDRNVTIELNRPAAEWLADKGYDDKMGAAHPLGRRDPGGNKIFFFPREKKGPGGLVRGNCSRQAGQGWQRQGSGRERTARSTFGSRNREPADRARKRPRRGMTRGLTPNFGTRP